MKKITLTIVLMLTVGFAFSQIAELRIKKNFPLQISYVSELSDILPFVDSLSVVDSNQICFKITPQRTGKTWSNKYPEMLLSLKLYQDKYIGFDHIASTLPEYEDEMMVYFVDKNKLKLSQPFNFKYESVLSSAMKLPETLMNNYIPFMELFSKAENQINNRFYIEAYKTLTPLLPENERYDNYANLSKYNQGVQLIRSATLKYFETSKSGYDNFLSEIEGEADINIGYLNTIRDIYFDLTGAQKTFSLFLNSEGDLGVESSDINQKYESILSDISVKTNELEDEFEKQTLAQFTYRDYNDSHFKFLIDGITHIFLGSEGISLMNGFNIDSLETKTLINNKVLNQIMQSDHSRNLELMLLANMISENLQQNLSQNKKEYVIFDKGIFDHLESLQYNERNNNRTSMEPKPYYLLLRGFDLMIADGKNVSAFNNYLRKAMQLTGDVEMIEKINLWLTACKFNLLKEEEIYDVKASIKLFNSGYQYFQHQEYDSALLFFQKAQNRYDGYPDAYYFQGLVYLKRGQSFMARYQFKRTLQVDREYLPAIIQYCELTNNKADAEGALSNIEAMLASSEFKTKPPFSQSTFWYLNYIKARMLFILENYSNCMAALDTDCKRLNPFPPNIYVLEGLVNIKRNDGSSASASFNIAMENAMGNYFNYEAVAKKIQLETKGNY